MRTKTMESRPVTVPLRMEIVDLIDTDATITRQTTYTLRNYFDGTPVTNAEYRETKDGKWLIIMQWFVDEVQVSESQFHKWLDVYNSLNKWTTKEG